MQSVECQPFCLLQRLKVWFDVAYTQLDFAKPVAEGDRRPLFRDDPQKFRDLSANDVWQRDSLAPGTA